MYWVSLTLMVVLNFRSYREGRRPVVPRFPLFSLLSHVPKLQLTSTSALVTYNRHVWLLTIFENDHNTDFHTCLMLSALGDGPKHADEEIWSSGSTLPLSLHLFFNLSGIQSQTRHGYQLYVTAAKLRLLKFAEVNQRIIGLFLLFIFKK